MSKSDGRPWSFIMVGIMLLIWVAAAGGMATLLILSIRWLLQNT